VTPEALSIASLVCFALGAAAAIAAFRVEQLRSTTYQMILVGAGILLKTGAIGMACAQRQNHFFNSPSDVASLMGWALGCSYFIALCVSAARSLGAVILPLVVILMALSLVLSTGTVDPGISGRMFAIHILSAFLGYGLFLTACGASILYLEQARLLKRKAFGAIFRDLPSLEKLERLEIICSWLGLATFTLAIVTGAMMASELHKPFWLEPKYLAAQVTWLIFGVLVIGRAVRWLHGRTAAKFVLAGASLVLITFALSHPFGRPAATAVTGDKWQVTSEWRMSLSLQERDARSAEGRS
jgi:ABC-type uncharacterized transport system permease subunit